MDANGTRFHLVLGERDWRDRATWYGVEWNDARAEVILQRRPYHFPASEADRPPTIADRRGAARDIYGNWYWISESSTEILVLSAGSRTTSVFWSPAMAAPALREPSRQLFQEVAPASPPSAPAALRGLTITSTHYLVVGTAVPDGLLIFDLHGGGAPQHLCWPPEVPFSPFDMAATQSGEAWILDRDHARLWQLDAGLRVARRVIAAAPETETFAAADGGQEPARQLCGPRFAIRLEDAWAAPANAVAVETLSDGALLVLDQSPHRASTVHYYGAPGGAPVSVALDEFKIAGHDIAVAPPVSADQQPKDVLYVVSDEGNQTYAFSISRTADSLQLERIPEFFPMRLFGGKGLVAAGAHVYYDFGRAWIPLVDQHRPRHAAEGEVVIRKLDGREPDCTWHRLLIDACIPPDAAVDVWSRAANTEPELEVAEWRREPQPYRRSESELPFAPSGAGADAGTWELLFQNAYGRFLDLRLVLRGNGRSTPRLRALRAYYPRFSYLQYLPAVYREDRESASFLERFLANVEGTLTSIEDRVAAAQVLLDVRSAPSDALEWLASWIGLALDPAWDDRKRRALLQHAPTVFARRGTIDGLRIALALSLSDCVTGELFTDTSSLRSPAAGIRIVEQFRTRRAPPVVSGDPTQATGLRELVSGSRWTPKGGRDTINAAWGESFPLAEPTDRDRAREWRALADSRFGFVPGVARVSAARWRKFIAGRYHGVASYNEVYSRTGHPAIRSFDEVRPPTALPADGAPLIDWYDFETRVVAMAARAHQFLVLLPMGPDAQADSAQHQRALELARRVTAIEKPAHTSFDVRFYWALFRVGEVRLGLDTVIGPRRNLLTPFVLDRSHLAESFLAPSHPQNVRDRSIVTGRGRLRPPRTTGETS